MSVPGVTTEELDSLRAELEGIDRSIILLLGERIRTARHAIAVRRHHGEGVTNAVQEARVLRRARLLAEAFGVPLALAERLWEDLIEAGKLPGPAGVHAPVVTVFLDAPTHPGPARTHPRPVLAAPGHRRPSRSASTSRR